MSSGGPLFFRQFIPARVSESAQLTDPGFQYGIYQPCTGVNLLSQALLLRKGAISSGEQIHALIPPGCLIHYNFNCRWCPTLHDYFAISTRSPLKGAVIHVHNTAYINAQPTTFTLASRPLQIRDFDFLAMPGIPRIACCFGQEVVIFYIGIES